MLEYEKMEQFWVLAFRLLKELCEIDKLEQKGSGKLSAYFIK